MVNFTAVVRNATSFDLLRCTSSLAFPITNPNPHISLQNSQQKKKHHSLCKYVYPPPRPKAHKTKKKAHLHMHHPISPPRHCAPFPFPLRRPRFKQLLQFLLRFLLALLPTPPR